MCAYHIRTTKLFSNKFAHVVCAAYIYTMKIIKTAEHGTNILVLTDRELADMKTALYYAMKSADAAAEESGGQGSDKALADRLEVLHDKM